MPWGSIISAGGSLLGGLFGSDAADDAARAQQRSAAAAMAQQQRQFDETKAMLAPYRETGDAATKRLRTLLGLGDETGAADYGSLMKNFTAADMNADPVYQNGLQFGLDEGRNAINARAIANGGYDSGATLKALTRFGNDYGSTKGGEAYNRFQNNRNTNYNMLSGTANAGQSAAAGTGAMGMQNAATMGNLITDSGNAAAAGKIGAANAWSNAFGGVGSAIQGYQNNNILKGLMGGRGSSGGYSAGDVNAMFGY